MHFDFPATPGGFLFSAKWSCPLAKYRAPSLFRLRHGQGFPLVYRSASCLGLQYIGFYLASDWGSAPDVHRRRRLKEPSAVGPCLVLGTGVPAMQCHTKQTGGSTDTAFFFYAAYVRVAFLEQSSAVRAFR